MSEIKLDFWGHDRGVDALYRNQRRDAISRLKRRRYDEIYSSSPIKDVKLRFIFNAMYRSAENFERPSRAITNAFSLLKLVEGKHRDNGYVLVSACRHENTESENIRDTKELEQWIRDEGFDYKRVYGGWVEDGLKVLETSFIVFNFYRGGNKRDVVASFIDLIRFAELVCSKYKQDSVMIVEPIFVGKPPYLVDKFGKKCSSEKFSSDKVWFDDETKDYWTQYKDEQITFDIGFSDDEINSEIQRGETSNYKRDYRIHYRGRSIGINDI